MAPKIKKNNFTSSEIQAILLEIEQRKHIVVEQRVDMKLDAKKYLAKVRRSMTATGGGQEDTQITQIDERIRGINGCVALLSVFVDTPLDIELTELQPVQHVKMVRHLSI